MSILLDALKKSEQQRRLGKAPDVYGPIGAEPVTAKRRHRRIWWALAIVVVLALAWAGWQWPRPGGAEVAREQGSARVPAPPAARTDGGAGADAAAGIQADNDAASVQAAARTPVERLPRGPDAAGRAADEPGDGEPQAAARTSRVNESFTTFEAPDRAGGAQNVAQQARESAPPAPAPAAPSEVAWPEPRTGGPAAGARPKATEPISFWELPQGVRDSLPELRITVLVYAERPEDRFLLLAGQRLVENDEYQPGIVLDEIRRDGAVFRYRNYRFLVEG